MPASENLHKQRTLRARARRTRSLSAPCGGALESLREYDQFDLNGGAVQVPADASCASTRPDGMGQMRKCRRTWNPDAVHRIEVARRRATKC